MLLKTHTKKAVIDAVRKVAGMFVDSVLGAIHKIRGKFAQKSTHENRLPAVEAVKRGSVKNKTVAIVPVYNHGETVRDVVATLRGYGLPVILVDDGSDTFTARTMDEIVSTKSAFGPPVKLVRLPKNRGKGAAVMTGFRSAYGYKATHVLQVDADGQHGLEVVPRFLDASVQNPDAVIAGSPHYDAMVPRIRLYGSRLTLLSVWINTLSRRIVGPMCGFRLYPLEAVREILPMMAHARRMDFDTEIAVRLDWENVPFVNLPVAIRYPLGGVSHFRIVRDNLLILVMHVRLFFGMLRRLPGLLSRHPRLSSRFSRCSDLVSHRFRLGQSPNGSPPENEEALPGTEQESPYAPQPTGEASPNSGQPQGQEKDG